MSSQRINIICFLNTVKKILTSVSHVCNKSQLSFPFKQDLSNALEVFSYQQDILKTQQSFGFILSVLIIPNTITCGNGLWMCSKCDSAPPCTTLQTGCGIIYTHTHSELDDQVSLFDKVKYGEVLTSNRYSLHHIIKAAYSTVCIGGVQTSICNLEKERH